jgi:choline dehydrogenase-like flavoprotein
VELKRRLHDAGPWTASLGAFAETLPRRENRVSLSSQADEYGVPIPRIECTWGPNELAMRPDMKTSAAEMLEAAGCKRVRTFDNHKDGGLGAEPGLAIHEMGTARMGRDPKTSVLNGWNQAHDVPNLFVTDGACMASASCVNPSITYMALTARACDYAVRQMNARSL